MLTHVHLLVYYGVRVVKLYLPTLMPLVPQFQPLYIYSIAPYAPIALCSVFEYRFSTACVYMYI